MKKILAAFLLLFSLGTKAQTNNGNHNGGGNNGNGQGNGEPIEERPLPVTLLSFTGNNTGSDVVLEWTVADVQNHSHYEVEHSSTGWEFTTIFKTEGFLYIHTSPTKNNYYRLVDVSRDGKRTVHPIIYVRVNPTVFEVTDFEGVPVGTYFRFQDIPTGKPLIINGEKTIISAD